MQLFLQAFHPLIGHVDLDLWVIFASRKVMHVFG